MSDTQDYTLSLGPLDSSAVALIRSWRNDYRIWQYTRQNDYLDDLEHESWFRRQSSDPSIKMYRIELTGGDKTSLVGVCGFTSIDYRNRRAEFSLYIAPAFQRRGLGKKALAILVSHGFENHGFQVIYGETFAGNPAAGLFEGLGFKLDGTRRQFYYKEGAFIDAHLYSLLREEFDALRRDSTGPHDDHDDGKPAPRPVRCREPLEHGSTATAPDTARRQESQT